MQIKLLLNHSVDKVNQSRTVVQTMNGNSLPTPTVAYRQVVEDLSLAGLQLCWLWICGPLLILPQLAGGLLQIQYQLTQRLGGLQGLGSGQGAELRTTGDGLGLLVGGLGLLTLSWARC